MTLLHEVLHYSVRRKRKGNPSFTSDMDHYALAMLGDKDEKVDLNAGRFDCVYSKCKNGEECLKKAWKDSGKKKSRDSLLWRHWFESVEDEISRLC